MSAAAGRAGEERAQSNLRLAMNPFMAHVISGPEVMLANSSDAFDENEHLTNERTVAGIENLMAKLRPS